MAISNRRYDCTDKYLKEHIFEEIQETYHLLCLDRGRSSIRFVRERDPIFERRDMYTLICDVLDEAKKLKELGAGKVIFSTTPDRPKKGEVRHNV